MPTLVIQSFDRPDGSKLITRVSTAADGTQADRSSYNARISADGRYVLFEGNASNLVAGDTNGSSDVFRKDLITGAVVRVSTAADGAQGNGDSYNMRISADGRYVLFESDASNLVAGDTNGSSDIFRKDLITGAVVRVSTSADGAQANDWSSNPQLSADGRYVLFESDASNLVADDTNGTIDVFLKDLVTGAVVRVSSSADGIQANDSSFNAHVSADGRYVLFESDASNLVAGDTNGSTDIFRKDLVTGEVVRISTATDGTEGNSLSSNAQLSADGRYVLFRSYASNLVAGDTNGASDIFYKDLLTGAVVRVSTAADGGQAGNSSYAARFSPDGRYVLFESDATNLVAGDTNGSRDIFRKDLMTGEVVRLTTFRESQGKVPADGSSLNPQLSADGRYVLFESDASNLVAGDTNRNNDIFLKDLNTGEVVRVSTSTSGAQGNDASSNPQLSADSRYVVFESRSNSLVTGDFGSNSDIFRKDLNTGELVRLSTAADGTQANGDSLRAQVSADGQYVLFESSASNLVANDTNGSADIFRKDLGTGEVVRASTAADGTEGNHDSSNAQFSADGRYVVFQSRAGNLVAGTPGGGQNIFCKDLDTGEMVLVSAAADGTPGNGWSYDAQVSEDGRYVLFESDASNLVAGDTNARTDIFRKDMVTGEVVRLSTTADGTQTNGRSSNAQFSGDGRYIVFRSDATNLVAGDTNNSADIFRKDLVTGEVVCLSWTNQDAQGDEQANNISGDASYSPDARFILIRSDASNLVSGDSNGLGDIFVVDAFFSNQQAMQEKRFAFVKFGVGGASSVTMAWGDGTVETVAPTLGSAVFSHAYATSGLKAALVTVKQGTLTWHVPHRIDLAAGQMVRNTGLSDTLVGSTGKDAISGDAFANIVIGGSGNDTIKGNSGNDRLYGGTGNDVLSGGSGRDIFVFDKRPSKTSNLDTITDFNPTDDTFWLDNAIFTKLGRSGSETRPVKLNSKFFKIGSAAGDANDYLIYNSKTGALFYDSNGSASGGMVQIAKLKVGLKLTYNDFFVV